MNLEKFGTTLACPPDLPINIHAESLANLLLSLHLHRSNLAKANEVLLLENPDGSNEGIAEVRAALTGMGQGLAVILDELLRVAQKQGLRIAATSELPRH